MAPESSESVDARTRDLLRQALDAASLTREALQNQAVELNLPLARRLARRYGGRGVAEEDLEQVARVGLLEAVRRFDPTRPSFHAFAIPTVLGELRRYFRDHAWMVRPGRQVQDLQSQVTSTRDRLRAEQAREPSVDEVAAALGSSVEAVREAEAVLGAFTPWSLDALAPGGDLTHAERLGDVDHRLQVAEWLQAAAPTIRTLPDDDRRLLHLRYVEDRTQIQIGRELGMSQVQVSRRLSRLIARIREDMGLDR